MRITFAIVLVALAVSVVRATPNVTTSVDVPKLAQKLDPLPEWPVVSATKTGVVIEGKAIVSIANGDVDPSEKEGGVLGIKIPRIAQFTKALVAASKSPPAGMLVALDQTTPYSLMIELLFSIKSAGIKQFDFVAKGTADTLGVIQLTLPDKNPDAKDKGLALVVTMTKDKLLVWSISGQEGTLQKPKATLKPAELDALTKTLADIKQRHKSDTTVIVMCDGAIPMSSVLPLLGTARTAFPDVQLSSGFQ